MKSLSYAYLRTLACAMLLGGCATQPAMVAAPPVEPHAVTPAAPATDHTPPPQATIAALVPEPAPEPPPPAVTDAESTNPTPDMELPPPPLVEEDTDLPLPPPPDPGSLNVWDQLGTRFALAPQYRDYPRVQQELAWYTHHATYMLRVSERAAPYLHYIVEEVEKRHMPAELVLLPIVESAFQPYAYSPGRAAGIWQFIPDTARRFGLRLNWWYDGRRDVMASTQAALNYLERLHTQLGGDWLLALAAYNNGEGVIMRAVESNRQRGLPTDFWSLQLRQETSSYVPRLLAVAALVMEAPRYGVRLYPVPDKSYLAKIDTGSQIDLALAADMAGLKVEELYKLNPGFNRWATDPNGPHYLVVPADKAEDFQTKLAALPATQRMRWTRYTVAKHESLLAVAQRYDTSVDLLRRVNKLSGKKVRTGEELLVPVVRKDKDNKSKVQIAKQDNDATTDKASPKYYTVRAKDTLYSIAKRHDLTVPDVLALNNLPKHATLHPGQRLIVAAAAATPPSIVTVAAAVPAVTANLPIAAPDADAVKRRVSYTVRHGESLKDISRRFNVSEWAVRKWNDLKRRAHVRPGRVLTLFVDVTNLAETS